MIEKYHIERLESIINAGGPQINEFADFKDLCHEFWVYNEQSKFLDITHHMLNEETLHKHMVEWPHGVPGDFELMEKFYDRSIRSDHFTRFDQFIQVTEPVEALRFRAFLLQDILRRQDHINKSDNPISVLDMACGSGRALREAETTIASLNHEINYLGVDSLQAAVDFAAALNPGYVFEKGNALRYRDNCQYDIIWSAGLFDYLSDRLFVGLCKKWLKKLKPGGQLVVGNFSTRNSMRAYMDLVGWKLEYRTVKQLQYLGEMIGDDYHVESDSHGINLYLIVKKL